MMIRAVSLALACSLLGTLPARAQDSTWTPAQESVWEAVQARWQAWQDDDFDAYLAAHHNTWHRWALRSEELEDREAVETFWQRAKEFQETIAFVLDPVAVEIYGDGQFAALHYVADETVRLLRERVNREGRTIPAGDETHILIRFSDFYVLEGEDWLFVGGYRDGNCALFRGFGKALRQVAAA